MTFLDQLKDGARLVKETTSTVISEGKQNAENLRKKKGNSSTTKSNQ